MGFFLSWIDKWSLVDVVKIKCIVIVSMKAKVSMPVVIVCSIVKQWHYWSMMKGFKMTPDGRQKLKQLLVGHESYKQFPYTDTTGHLTIGIGRNLTNQGISITEAAYLLDDDIQYFYGKLSHFLNFFPRLSENRQIALVDMCFNVGVQGFLNFTNMILALESNDYERAAKEMLNSKWAEQVGERATCLANIIRTGEI